MIIIKQKSFIPDVVITLREGVEYLGDQTRRYGRDKMPPLLCRILKLRKISAKHVLNSKGQKVVSVNTFLLAALKSYSFANFSTLIFDGCTGTNSSLLPQMTFILKMTKFTSIIRKYRSLQVQMVDTLFISKTLCVDLQVSTSKTEKNEFYEAQQANFGPFFNLGFFKAKSRSNLPLHCL